MSHLRQRRGQASAVLPAGNELALDPMECLWQRRMMAYRFKPHRESIEEGFRRIVREQLRKAIASCVDPDGDVHERVHDVRKRCKKVRGLHRLVRESAGDEVYQVENTALRDIARSIAYPRDVQVMRKSYDVLLDECELDVDRNKLAPIARALTIEVDAVVEQDLAGRLERLTGPLQAASERVQVIRLRSKGFEAVAGGLKKSYKRARNAMRKAYAERCPEHFHDFRKRAKYHRYHIRLLRPLWPETMLLRDKQLHRLTDALGEEHDFAVLHKWLQEKEPASEEARAFMRGLVLERRERCQKHAKLLARRLFCDSANEYRDHLRTLSKVIC